MTTLLNKSNRCFDGLINTTAVISGGILLFMMLLVCYDVVMRYLFRNPTGWSMEVCEYLLVYLTFLGSPWLLREKGHVNVDILFFFTPKSVMRRCKIFTSLAMAIATLVLCIFGAAATWDFFQREIIMIKMLTLPKWTLLWIIPFGFGLLCIESFRQLFSNISGSEQLLSSLKQQSLPEEKE